MKAVIYTLPNCPNCDATKRFLKDLSIKIEEVSLVEEDENGEIRGKLKKEGVLSAPYVELYEEKLLAKWSGPLSNMPELDCLNEWNSF